MPSPQDTTAPAEAAAREMGWRPLEEFRGDPDKWVDAETFVSRGEHFLPILRANNKRLQEQQGVLSTELAETRRLLEASQEAISELKKYHDEDTKRQIAKARRDLIKEIKQAREDGDVDREVELQTEVNRLDTAVANAPAAPAPAPTAPKKDATVDPDFIAWEADNPWFRTDKRKNALAMAIAQELRGDPANAKLVGRAFYDRISQEMEEYLSPADRSSKVGSGRSGGGGRTAPPATRQFSDLPAEAKDACAMYAKRLVGPGRAYKDLDAWRAEYTRQYFEGETE